MIFPTDPREHRLAAVEFLALESVGMLDGDGEGRWVREHLDSGCSHCESAQREVSELFESMLYVAAPVQPPAAMRDRVLRSIQNAEREPVTTSDQDVQVWNRWTATEAKFFTLPSDASPWEATGAAGVTTRKLHVGEASGTITMVVRMAPGVSYPRHRHSGDEHCYVLEGDICVEDQVLRAGDYQFAPVGSVHGVQSTREGCTLLIVSSRSDELLTD